MIFGFDSAAARRWAELVTRLFGLESADAPLPPGFLLEVDRPEWRLLKRELLWTTGPISIAASVGNFGRVQIHNPANSDRLVIIEGFVAYNAAVGGYLITIDGALAGSPTANLAIDNRVTVAVGGVRKTASLNRIDNTLPAASGTQVDRRSANVAGQDIVFNFRQGPMQPIILKPNTVCEIVCAIANQQLIALAYGYERPATPDELTA